MVETEAEGKRVQGVHRKSSRVLLLSGTLVLLGSGILVWLSDSLLAGLGHWLEVETPPLKANLVVALGGDRTRQDMAVSVLKEGLAEWVMFVGSDVRPHDYSCLAVPPEKAILPPALADTTYEEALVTRRVVQERELKSVLIVTSPYHLRRARWTFERVFAGTGIDLLSASAPNRAYSSDRWWKTHVGRKAVLSEYVALLYYWLTF